MRNANDNDYKLDRRNDPDTSVHAAKLISPSISEIKAQVLEYAEQCAGLGFTDDDLNAHFQSISSTYRSRRSELTASDLIVDSGLRRVKQGGKQPRKAIIWDHWAHAKKEISA